MRVLCLWIPHWPLQRLQVTQPSLRERPVLIYRTVPRRGEVITFASQRALDQGVQIGMPVAEAKSLWQVSATPVFIEQNEEQDRLGLQRLAWSCDRFSPVIGIEEDAYPESILMDITGCGRLFADEQSENDRKTTAPSPLGEQRLAEELVRQMHRYGLRVRVGIAETVGAAWAVAHARRSTLNIIACGEVREALQPLPIESLRLPQASVMTLHQLGVRRVRQLLALPRKEIPSRFSKELLTRIDQALGDREEKVHPLKPPEVLQERWEHEYPISHPDTIESLIAETLQKLIQRLQPTGLGLRRVQCCLNYCEQGISVVGEFSIELIQPTQSAERVMQLVRLQLERIALEPGVHEIVVIAERVESLSEKQTSLFVETSGDEQKLAQLLERLSIRLGKEAVLRAELTPEEQPELAYRAIPKLQASITSPQENSPTATFRPLWLKRTPVPIPVSFREVPVSLGYQRVIRSWGPERITTGWWREHHIRRDYWRIETDQGHHWIFQDLTQQNWYWHGMFG